MKTNCLSCVYFVLAKKLRGGMRLEAEKLMSKGEPVWGWCTKIDKPVTKLTRDCKFFTSREDYKEPGSLEKFLGKKND